MMRKAWGVVAVVGLVGGLAGCAGTGGALSECEAVEAALHAIELAGTATTPEGLQPHVENLYEVADEVRGAGLGDLADGLVEMGSAIRARDTARVDAATSMITIAVGKPDC